MVPEWGLHADIGDCALRLDAALLRYGNTTGPAAAGPPWPPGCTRSRSTVDRALAELAELGAVQVQHRWVARQRLTNRYRIRTSRPHGPTIRQADARACFEGVADGCGHPSRRRRGPEDAATPRMRPGVAARIRPGWPHGCGPTESLLPRHHHPSTPVSGAPPHQTDARNGHHRTLARSAGAVAGRLRYRRRRRLGRVRRPGPPCSPYRRPTAHPVGIGPPGHRARPCRPWPRLASRPSRTSLVAGCRRPEHPQPRTAR